MSRSEKILEKYKGTKEESDSSKKENMMDYKGPGMYTGPNAKAVKASVAAFHAAKSRKDYMAAVQMFVNVEKNLDEEEYKTVRDQLSHIGKPEKDK